MADNKETNNCSSIFDSLIKGMDSVLVSKTVVGEATKIGDNTIILPLVDVTFGVGAGAAAGAGEKGNKNGGAGCLSGKMSPSAVLVIQDGHTKLVNIKNQDTMTKILDMVPDVIDKISELTGKSKMPTDEEAIDAADFPEDDE